MRRSRLLIALGVLVLVAASCAALSACGGSASSASPSASSSGDAVALVVDGTPVYRSAVDAVLAELRLGGTQATRARAEREAVRRELVRREAGRLGVVADEDEIEERRQTMISEVGSEDALAAALEQVPMTEEQLRSGLSDAVLAEAVQDARYGDVHATTAAARAYYKRHRSSFRRVASAHLWMIQVAAERIAESAIERLRAGHPFAEVARQFSSDPESKAAGGDMGTVALASLPTAMRSAVESTPPGKVTEPVQGTGGWFVLKATNLKPARVLPFTKVKDDVLTSLTRQKRAAALDAWLDEQRSQATVTRP